MPLNFPSSPVNGQTYADNNGVVWEYDNVKWKVISGTTNRMYSGVKLKFSSNTSLTSVSTAISFDTETFDTDSYFTLSVPNRVSIARAGFYRINFSVYSGTNGSSYTINIKKNGSTTLATAIIAPNQYTNFDEIIELSTNDYVEVYASEATSTGTLLTDTVLEITRLGSPMGTTISPAETFSGARGVLTSDFSTTNTPVALTWSTTAFNQNADSIGSTYWNVSQASRFTVAINAFYRLKIAIAIGSTDNCTISLKKNNTTTLATATIEPNGYAQIDEIYSLNTGDYLELIVNDTNSVGTIDDSSYFEIVRIGV